MKNVTKSAIIEFLKQEVSKECRVPYEAVNADLPFADFAMDSLQAVYVMDRLEKFIGVELSPLYFWDYPTIDSLSDFIENHIMEK
jgi:acyl carrier protein